MPEKLLYKFILGSVCVKYLFYAKVFSLYIFCFFYIYYYNTFYKKIVGLMPSGGLRENSVFVIHLFFLATTRYKKLIVFQT